MCMVLMTVASAAPKFDDVVQTKLRDLTMKATVGNANRGELRKISNDFYLAYSFTSMDVKYKSPSKLRLDGRYKNTSISYILNGPTKLILVPALKQKSTEDTKSSPGKRQSLLDFGIIDKGVTDFMKGEFVREDRETGDWIFDLRYQYFDDTSRHRCWIDPKIKVVKKREWYSQEGKLKATFYYRDFKQVDGVYVPTTVEVRNVDGKSAGTTKYQNIEVNTGAVKDSNFSA